MSPIIQVNDELVLGAKPPSYRRFDIILFKRHNRLNAHFVWRDQTAFDGTYVTRSLKEPYHDEEPIKSDDILGPVENFRLSMWRRLAVIFGSLIRGKL